VLEIQNKIILEVRSHSHVAKAFDYGLRMDVAYGEELSESKSYRLRKCCGVGIQSAKQ